MSWVYQTVFGADGKCRVAMAQSKVQAMVTMPRWPDSSWASETLQLTWALRLRELREHEQQHVRHGIAAAEAVQKTLLALPATESCEALKSDVERTARAILDDAAGKDRSLDFRSVHGIAGPTVRTYATPTPDGVNPTPSDASLELVEVIPTSGTAVSKDTVVEAKLRFSFSHIQEDRFVVVPTLATTTEQVTTFVVSEEYVLKEASGTLRTSFHFGSVWGQPDIRHPYRLWFYLIREIGPVQKEVVAKTEPIEYYVRKCRPTKTMWAPAVN